MRVLPNNTIGTLYNIRIFDYFKILSVEVEITSKRNINEFLYGKIHYLVLDEVQNIIDERLKFYD